MSAPAKTPAAPARAQKKDDDYIPRPDRSAFLEQLNKYRQELDGHRAALAKHKQAIDDVQTQAAPSAEEAQLREEHSRVLGERNTLRDLEKSAHAEAKRIEDSVKAKIAELQLLRPKSGPRSLKETDQQIATLESRIEAGQMSIADENRSLKEISALKRQRASFDKADKLQAEIDEVRERAAEVRRSVDSKALKALLATKAEIEKKLDVFKEQRQQTRQKLNGAHDTRRATHSAIKELNTKMDELRAKFDSDMTEFNEKLRARKEQREQEEASAKQEAANAKKIAAAESKLAAAKEPAYGAQIEKAQRLLAYFDPSAASSADAPTAPAASAPDAEQKSSVSKALNAPSPQGQTLRPAAANVAPPSRKSQRKKASASTGSAQPLNIDINIIDALSSLNVSLPRSPAQVEATKTQLKEKIEFYKENNDRVTKERVQRAEEELQQVKAELAL